MDAEVELRRQERRVSAAQEAVANLQRAADSVSLARGRLLAQQATMVEGASKELTAASSHLASYLSGGPQRTVSQGGANLTGSSSVPLGDAVGSADSVHGVLDPYQADVAHVEALALTTAAGAAYYEQGDQQMRGLASVLSPFPGEFTVDMHGSEKSVEVGPIRLDAVQLAQVIRSEKSWKGRPVRLFSCDTGAGEAPIARDLAKELGVKVTAPRAKAWSDLAGRSWVAPSEWKRIGGSLVRVSGAPLVDGWVEFTPEGGKKR